MVHPDRGRHAGVRRGHRRGDRPGLVRGHRYGGSAQPRAYRRRAALRALTFHQRAALLSDLAAHLRGHREELYALSARTGATPYDSKFDIDGGIRVLLHYAALGLRELPGGDERLVYAEGPQESLSRDGSFVGGHVCTPLRGVAVQINAYNFPVWAPLEKLAPAVLAGCPQPDQARHPDLRTDQCGWSS